MAILVTERTRRVVTDSLNGQGRKITTAMRTLDVSGVSSNVDALDNCGVNIGDAHPQSESAVCNYRNATQLSVGGMYQVDCQYTSDSTLSIDLTLQPPVITYEPYIYQVASYIDANGVNYTNTAGTPFDQPMEIDVCGFILSIAKWEMSYPVEKMFTYGGKTNLGTFSWPGGTALEGCAKCLGVYQGETASDTGLVKVVYKFDMRNDGHKHNVPDMGSRGFCTVNSATTSGVFVTGDSATSSVSVRLDGNGVPIDTGFKVKPSTNSPTFSAIPPSPAPGSKALVSTTLSRDDLKVISFARSKSIVFDLGI